MSEKDKVTYAELKFQNSMNQKNKINSVHKKKESPNNVIIKCLGIVCLFLLLAILVLSYMFFQCSSECKIQENKDNSSSEMEDYIPLPPSTENNCDIFQGKWSCCGKSCYYLSKEEKSWHESSKTCPKLGSTFIKIDDIEEQSFIQTKIKQSYWVGLYKKRNDLPWMWPDGTRPSWTLRCYIRRNLFNCCENQQHKNLQHKMNKNFQTTMSTLEEKCGRLKSTHIVDDACSKEFYYICEKKSGSS